MTSVATQSIIDDFRDNNGIVIEPGHFLIVDHINSENRVAYSFYRVLDVKPNAMTYGFLFYGDQDLKNVPLGNYHFDRKQTATVEHFNNIKALFKVYIVREEWQSKFDSVKNDWELNDIQGRDFHRRMSPVLEERGPTQGGK